MTQLIENFFQKALIFLGKEKRKPKKSDFLFIVHIKLSKTVYNNIDINIENIKKKQIIL